MIYLLHRKRYARTDPIKDIKEPALVLVVDYHKRAIHTAYPKARLEVFHGCALNLSVDFSVEFGDCIQTEPE